MRRTFQLLAALIYCLFAPSLAAPAEPKVEEISLADGLRVFLRPIEGAKSVALVLLFPIGGDHDFPEAAGMAHLVEHLYVTAAAGKIPARTADAWANAHPLGWNAHTGDDYTEIATVFEPKDLEAEIEEIAARMDDLQPTDADLAREVPRIREELGNMYGGSPDLAATNLARQQWREPNKPYPRRGGFIESISKIPLAAIRTRLKKYYKPAHAILVAAGAFDPVALKALLVKRFASVPGGEEHPGKAGLVTDPPSLPPPPPPRVLPFAVTARVPGSPKVVSLAAFSPSLAVADRSGAVQLVVAARLFAETADPAFGGSPAPVFFEPLDAPDTLCLSARVAPGQSADEAVARLEAVLRGAVRAKLTREDIARARALFGVQLGLSDVPDAALAERAYEVAFGIGRRRQLGIDGARLSAALNALTQDDFREPFSTEAGTYPAVVVIPK